MIECLKRLKSFIKRNVFYSRLGNRETHLAYRTAKKNLIQRHKTIESVTFQMQSATFRFTGTLQTTNLKPQTFQTSQTLQTSNLSNSSNSSNSSKIKHVLVIPWFKIKRGIIIQSGNNSFKKIDYFWHLNNK
jgi:hypothetical protein